MVTNIEKPILDDIIYYYGDDKIEIEYTEFVSDGEVYCNYYWNYTVQVSDSEDLTDVVEHD